MDKIIQITDNVGGKRYNSRRYYYDDFNTTSQYEEEERQIEWKSFGETVSHKKPVFLGNILKRIAKGKSWFKYFLDGSRRTYKVDDMAFGKDVYPVMAGQVGISCCIRDNKEIKSEFFKRKMVIVLPSKSLLSQWDKNDKNKISLFLDSLNEAQKLKQYNLKFDNVIFYDTATDLRYENKAITKIQEFMIEQEKMAVMEIIGRKKVKQKVYMIKDGSLEYKAVENKKFNLSEERMKNAYNYVIGVSKSFNPTKCYVKGGGTDSSIIAELKPLERTPAYLYASKMSGENVFFLYLVS